MRYQKTMDETRTGIFAVRTAELKQAAAFLTLLPVGAAAPADGPNLARAFWAFPVIGALIGAIGALVFAFSGGLGLPVLARALLALGATALLTGGLHEDGLADTADGLGGGADRAAMLAIMRDSRSGVFGVMALIFSVGLRVSALTAMADSYAAADALVAAHAVSRGLLPGAMLLLTPARGDGLGAGAGKPSAVVAVIAVLIALVFAVLCLGPALGITALIVAALGMGLVGLLAWRRLGGYTGDVLGAAQQAGEILVLLAAAR